MTPLPEQRQSEATLTTLARTAGIELNADQSERLLSYISLLNKWNRVYNLTAIHDPAQAFSHHLMDCLAIIQPLHQALRDLTHLDPDQPLTILDAGSGGGLPAIPLAITHPNWTITPVDTVQKKCAFLLQASVELHLGNVHPRHARLENLDCPPQDLVISRAFASLVDFVRLTEHLLAQDGRWIAMKGKLPIEELEQLPAHIRCERTVRIEVPHLNEERHLLILARAPHPQHKGQ
jgi:16S rRNA (guanine527-N7)-methyltransferase